MYSLLMISYSILMHLNKLYINGPLIQLYTKHIMGNLLYPLFKNINTILYSWIVLCLLWMDIKLPKTWNNLYSPNNSTHSLLLLSLPITHLMKKINASLMDSIIICLNHPKKYRLSHYSKKYIPISHLFMHSENYNQLPHYSYINIYFIFSFVFFYCKAF